METAQASAVFLVSLSLVLIAGHTITYMVGKHKGPIEVEVKLFGLRLTVKRPLDHPPPPEKEPPDEEAPPETGSIEGETSERKGGPHLNSS